MQVSALPFPREYRDKYDAGWRASNSGRDVLDRADRDGRSADPGWMDGYSDAAEGNPRWHRARVRFDGTH
jgi:hypothetical protein